MKVFRIIAAAMALLTVASCSNKVKIKATVLDAPSKSTVSVLQLDGSSYKVIDSVRTNRDGRFTYSVKLKKNQPEFYYFYYKDTKIASLLLDKAGKVSFEADTLGHYSVKGSDASEELHSVEISYSEFISTLNALIAKKATNAQISRSYVDYYRDRAKYVLSHTKSLTSIPVLYQQINENTPVFGQTTDALYFRAVLDSLKTVYPKSRYLVPLEKETARREQLLGLEQRFKTASEQSFPDISLPDINGKSIALSSVDAKLVFLYFWNPADNAQKMFNFESLLPLYEKYKSRGFEVFAVGLDYDKVNWASSVRAQKLPWINVFDARGVNSPALSSYNIGGTPGGILIYNGEIAGPCISGEQELRRELGRLL